MALTLPWGYKNHHIGLFMFCTQQWRLVVKMFGEANPVDRRTETSAHLTPTPG